MELRFGIVWIEGDGRGESFGGGVEVPRAFGGDAQKKARAALAGEEFDGLAERGGGGSGIFFEEEDTEVEMGLGQFGIEFGGFFVFGSGIVVLVETSKGVGELKVGEGDVGLFGEKFLEGRDGVGVIVFVEGGLGFIEEIVERVAKFLGFSLGRFGWRCLREAACGEESDSN